MHALAQQDRTAMEPPRLLVRVIPLQRPFLSRLIDCIRWRLAYHHILVVVLHQGICDRETTTWRASCDACVNHKCDVGVVPM